MVKLHWRNPSWSDRILHCPFMRLVHKIPNVNSPVRLGYETYTRSTWTPTTSCMEAPLAYQTTKKRHLCDPTIYVYVSFPNAKVEIVNCEDNVFIAGKQIQRYNRSEASLLVPISSNGIVFAASFVCRSSRPVTDKKFPLIWSPCEDCSFFISIEGDGRSSHGSSSLGSK